MEFDDLESKYHDVREETRALPPAVPHHRLDLDRLRDTCREIAGRLNDFADHIDRWVAEAKPD